MKILLFIPIFFVFAACKHSPKKIGFATTDLKYSTYIWHPNSETNENKFYLADHLHIDGSGHFKLIKHNPEILGNHFYFTGILSDSIRHRLDSLLLENKFHPEINRTNKPDSPLIIYNGFTYFLDYNLSGQPQIKFQYINTSSRVPGNILFLTAYLDTVISKTVLNQVDSFGIEKSYLDTLKKISSYNLPPPPQPPPPDDKSIRLDPSKEYY